MTKIILRICKVILLALIAFIVLFCVINLGDENLKPEVKKILNWQLPANAYTDNGYIYLLGMDAAKDQDALQAGKNKLEAELARFAKAQITHQEQSLPEIEKLESLERFENYRCDFSKVANCVDFYLQQDLTQLKSQLLSFDYLNQRLTHIKNSKHYVEIIPPHVPFLIAPYGHLAVASEVNRIKAVLAISAGDTQTGIGIWLENAQYSRRLLKESSNLISRMIAVAMVQKDMRILAELITKYPPIAKQYEQTVLPVLQSIGREEFFMTKALRYERDLVAIILNQWSAEQISETVAAKNIWKKYLITLFYQSNAATNLAYDLGSLRLLLAESDAKHLEETKAVVMAKQDELLGIGIEPVYLKNPVAKTLILLSHSVYLDYIERQHDTDGYIHLVAMQVAIVANELNDESKIRQLMAKYPNPYTGQLMDFDPVKKQIRFVGRQKSPVNVGRSNVYTVGF